MTDSRKLLDNVRPRRSARARDKLWRATATSVDSEHELMWCRRVCIHTDVIRRGRFVRETFLCKDVPAIDILNVPPLPEDPKLTMREKLAMHTSDPTCAGCHGQMDPMGLGLEAFDEVGRERSMEAGKPINVQGGLVGSDDKDGAFVGLTGLMDKVVASETFRRCVVSHSFEYWMGRPPSQADDGDKASIDGIHRAYKDAGYGYQALLAALFTSEAFLFRKP